MLRGSFSRLLVPIETVKGVGPATAEKLKARQIETLEDALLFLPVRYQDRSRTTLVADLTPGQEALVAGEVVRVSLGRPGPRRVTSLTLEDGSGRLTATWFGLGGGMGLEKGSRVILCGRVDEFKGRPAMVHPELIPSLDDPDHAGRFVPLYRPIPGFSVRRFRRLVGSIIQGGLRSLDSPLPEELARKEGLLDLAEAFRRVHFPQEPADASLEGPPRRTLIFTELFLFQAGLGLSRLARREERSAPVAAFSRAREGVRAGLGFELTPAQERVLEEIAADLAGTRPMNRLLQGDVGSGKTVVAAAVLAATVLSGGQAALMVPTELLARQHQAELTRLANGLGIETALLTSSLDQAVRREVLAGLEEGRVRLVVGTQALIQEGVRFRNLNLAVIDEQHRFGIRQRAGLLAKGRGVHLLTMTATPIPRSLALTVYGDLEVSILDERPPGRRPVVTRLLPPGRIERAWQAVEKAAAQGLQTYVILPAVEPGRDLVSVKERHRKLVKRLSGLKVGLVHGKLDREEQVAVMDRFAAGKLDVLVATTVVEVGLDVPRAAVMVVEQAERFGLAQIHQLRGRVGRGGTKAACLLISQAQGQSRQRLKSLEETEDGFEIAEADLSVRGPGDFIGPGQTGWPDFRLADLVGDAELLAGARRAAFRLLEADPGLSRPEHRTLVEILDRRWLRRLRLSRAG